jgi:hypothetical protein
VRGVRTPYRILDDSVVAARPRDGTVLALTPLVGWLWMQLIDGNWATAEAVAAQRYPDVPAAERETVLQEALHLLVEEGLVEP